ncbi:flavodoxin family protein [Methanocella conradii]|uniref:flavodoxin family protein n=1 Tax=Methanocella conradii TaxID=1175444 RepID=UPI00157C7E9E|nr:flavodoxin family protein [Methanocella conradii]
MRVFGISGSPRLGGTHYAVSYALDYLKEKGCETRYFSARGKDIRFCIHCDYCMREKKGCIQKDGLAEFYEGMQWADGVVMGTPCYQGTLSGQLKAMMDRCRALVAKDPHVFKGKVGMGLAVGGDRNGGQEIAITLINNFFVINEMIPVSGGAFGANLGASLWSKDKGAEGVAADEEGLRSLRMTLKRFYGVLEERRVA